MESPPLRYLKIDQEQVILMENKNNLENNLAKLTLFQER